MATPLMAMPRTVRRTVLRFIDELVIGSRSARGALGGRAVSLGERRTAQPMEEVARHHAQGREAVHDAAPETDRLASSK